MLQLTFNYNPNEICIAKVNEEFDIFYMNEIKEHIYKNLNLLI